MRKILFLVMAACFLFNACAYSQAAKPAFEGEEGMGDATEGPEEILELGENPDQGRMLGTGEPTPEQRARMQREEAMRAMEQSGYPSMEDLSQDTTEEEDDFGISGGGM